MNDSIDLNNLKVAIFDFDDTLAIHKDKEFSKHRRESEDSFLNYYLNAYLNSESFYDIIEPCTKSDLLYELINKLRNKGVKMYCLSGMKFSFHLKAKTHFVHKYYGNDIEVISTQSQERKLDAVKIIQRINNCKFNQILFIDDLEKNIIRLRDLDVNAFLISDVNSLLIKEEE